jgi:hypothetical protein
MSLSKDFIKCYVPPPPPPMLSPWLVVGFGPIAPLILIGLIFFSTLRAYVYAKLYC